MSNSATLGPRIRLVASKKAAASAACWLPSVLKAASSKLRDSSRLVARRRGGSVAAARPCMSADPKFAKLGNLSDRHRRTASRNAARTLPQERHKQQPSVNAQKAATMSSWMKTLSAGANKVGQAPAQQSNVVSRRVGVAATASSAARKGCCVTFTPSTSARRRGRLTGFIGAQATRPRSSSSTPRSRCSRATSNP